MGRNTSRNLANRRRKQKIRNRLGKKPKQPAKTRAK